MTLDILAIKKRFFLFFKMVNISYEIFFPLHTLLALRQLSLSFACTVKTTWMEVAFYIAPGKDFVKERRVALYLESSSLCVPLLF